MLIDNLPDYPALRQVQHALWGAKDVRGAAVMVGAGFSKFANLASKDGRSPPLWNDFEVEMRKRLHGESLPNDALKLAEQYGVALGRHALDGLIRELVCDDQWTPGEMHSRLLGLPWADVLTTNWDTLLERTELQEPDRAYEVVRAISDIARTRSPRIVKLHGSLPSHEPFIFTAEDFRTYPKQFAPFVNLAQQVLLENELCLIGFSGDDPNFLEWSGWVRDQLGASARKIRLIGVLNLSPSRRQVLEKHNISPIDLAPLVVNWEGHEKHHRAMKLFIDSLWAAKPKPVHIWSRHKRNQAQVTIATELDAETFLQALATNWKADRLNYPGWLVAPPEERRMIGHDTSSFFPEFQRALSIASLDTRTILAYELIWRHEIAFMAIPENIVKLAQEALQNSNNLLNKPQRDEIQLALLRAARRRRDWTAFEGLAEAVGQSLLITTKDELAYELALRCRDELDFVGLAEAVVNVRGDDPVWAIRRSALQCELGEDIQASETILDAWNEIKKRRARDRESLWLLSREAWAAWLMKRVHFTLRKKLRTESQYNDEYDRWPVNYKAANCDPWDETTHIDHELSEYFNRQLKDAETIQPQFDAGTYKDNSRAIRFRTPISTFYELSALADQVGLSDSIGNFDVLGNRFVRSLEVENEVSEVAIWAAMLRLPNGADGFIERFFSRVQIARISLPLIQEIAHRLKKAIDYGRERLTSIGWVSRCRNYTELLSRLVVRFSPDEAQATFRWAIDLSNDIKWNHWWLFESLEHLLIRSIGSVPPLKRGELALSAMQMKLPKDNGSGGIERNWPELAFVFRLQDYRVRDTGYVWSQTITSLIEVVRARTDLNRTNAIWRLTAMHDAGILTEDEKKKFGEALWSQRQGPDSFPDHAQLYEQVFLNLPQPEPDLSQRLFKLNVIDRLASGDIDAHQLKALSASAHDNNGKTAYTALSVIDAKAIFKACLEWAPKNRDPSDIFARDTRQEIYDGIGPCLANAVLPVLDANDVKLEQIQKWSAALAKGSVASIVQTAPHLARLFPDRKAEAISAIRRSLAASAIGTVSSAIIAVNHLARLHAGDCDAFPSVLSADVVTMCATRRDPGLLGSLVCAGKLLKANLLIAGDERRLAEALEFLLIETDYVTWTSGDPRTPSLSLIRRECVRLANALKQNGILGGGIDGWLAACSDDPMPEVRFALSNEMDD